MTPLVEFALFAGLALVALTVLTVLVVFVAALRWYAQDMAHLRRGARRVSDGGLAR
jgi:hypothetical protein